MLTHYWPGETDEDRLYRWQLLHEFGCLPYPMPYRRTPESIGFQRWVVGSYAHRGITWAAWVAAGYDPHKVYLGESVLF